MFRILSLSGVIVIIIFTFICFVSAQEIIRIEGDEGENCDQFGRPGKCTRVTECAERENWWKLKICGYVGIELNAVPVVCCPTDTTTSTSTTTTTTTTPKPVATTPPMGPVTTEYVPQEYEYELVNPHVHSRLAPDGCLPMGTDRTTEPTGSKAWDKCLEYQTQLVYPCEESVDLTRQKVRVNNCRHNANVLIVGGVDAMRYEFPHMVLLGYGQSQGSAVWKCGGTLISDRFILTAAHCIKAGRLGYVNYAIVGSLKRTDNVHSSQVLRIARRIRHADFKTQTMHNDIALLETAQPIHLDWTTVPACLDVFGGNLTVAVATGWGATSFAGNTSDTLQKVTLTAFTDEECRENYPDTLKADFNSTTQLCYGDYKRRADTCQGDSGGPLTILNERVHCMYTVVGITSLGTYCGTPGVPGYYTKVAHYIPWIESVVWPLADKNRTNSNNV